MSIESLESLPDAEHWRWSDSDLVMATNAGCQEALSEIYRRFYTRLVRLCQVRVVERDIAEDVAQNSMMRAIRYLPTHNEGAPLWPWLRMIALRQCTTVARRRSREVSLEEQAELFQPASDPSDKLLEHLALHAALAELPARQRMALQLRYFEDVGIDEAAGIIGINRNAFDQLLSRGKSRLAAAFAEDRAVHGLSVVAVIAFLRRLTRRAAEVGPASAAPLAGATLAVAAGIAAMLSLQLGVAGTLTVPAPATEASSVVVSVPHAVAPIRTGALATKRHAAPGSAPVTPQVAQTYLTPHALATGGNVAGQRITVATPAGKVTVGAELDQGHQATVCGLLAGKNPAVTC